LFVFISPNKLRISAGQGFGRRLKIYQLPADYARKRAARAAKPGRSRFLAARRKSSRGEKILAIFFSL
jgi:hypothetical protein